MFFEEAGDKSAATIVFIHGGGMASWMWRKQVESFGDYHLLLPDLPEHGKSLDDGCIDIADSAERVAALIREHANGGKAHVVGHSLGGKIIVQMLADYPEVIDRAVVGSALFRPMPLMNMMLNMPAYRLTVWMLKNKAILDMQARQFGFPDDYYVEHFKQDALAETPEMLDRIYSQLNKYVALPQDLSHACVPTLVVAGEREPRAMRLSAGDIVSALPSARGVIIKGAQHTYPWAQSDAFNCAVRAWLEQKEISAPELLPLSS